MPRCPVCAGTNARPSFTKDDYEHFHCQDCDALYLFPVPSDAELSEYYVAQEAATRSSQCWERGEQDYRHYEPIWDSALRKIEQRAGKGPLLDVGCGGGQFLAFARERGWDEIEGIEVAPGAASRAAEVSGAQIHSVDFLASGFAAERYAGITMWNVIEHARDPGAFAREVARLLRPQGMYVADCPNRRGITMRVIGKAAYVVMPPEHLTYFSHKSLRRLLDDAGLRVRELSSNTVYINDWVRYLGAHKAEAEAREAHLAWYARATRSRLSLGMIAFANVLLNATGLGDQMLVAAQKPGPHASAS